MADKQATIYIVDQGKSTGDCHNGRVESDLEYAMQYVWDKITTAMATGRKGYSIGVLGLRTDNTDIPLEGQAADGFENLSVQKPLGQMEMSHLRKLQETIKPSNTDAGDALSAIALAVDMIDKFTRNAKGAQLKFERRIVLVTDGQGQIELDTNFIDGLTSRINEFQIELLILGVDFDDPEYGFKEEDKDTLKAQNEALLKNLVADCENGNFGTVAEAIEDLEVPILKKTRPYSTYRGQLTLGNPNEFDTAISIDVERYFRTKSAKPVSASSFVTRSDAANGEANVQSSNTLAGDTEMPDVVSTSGAMTAVQNARTYTVKDKKEAGGFKHVDREELEMGYEYGSTAVHIARSDENITKLETLDSFSIIGFIPMDKYERYLNMGESCITIAQQTNDKARMALSSLIHALFELESYAVARIVVKSGKEPVIILLAPSIETHLESLIDVPLPFAEDVRAYRFPPLDRVITTTGGVLEKHRNLPTEDLLSAMSDYVDSMDLSELGRDEGQPSEYMTIDETYSPLIHRIDQAIRHRVAKPEEGIKPTADILLKWRSPPAELVSHSASQLKKLVEAADVKRVPPRVKGKSSQRNQITPLSGLDVDRLLSQEKRQKITVENAIPEFKQMLGSATADNVLEDAAKQMGSIVRQLVSKSIAGSGYDRAIENLRVMREELSNLELEDTYNNFMLDMKKRIAKEELGGNRRDFWFQVRINRLGLFDNETGATARINEKEVKEFYIFKSELPSRNKSE